MLTKAIVLHFCIQHIEKCSLTRMACEYTGKMSQNVFQKLKMCQPIKKNSHFDSLSI